MKTINVKGFGLLSESIVTIRNPGQSFTCREVHSSLNVQNDVLSDIAFVKLDKGYYPEGNACDFSISIQTKASPNGFLLELKGCGIKHAVEQLNVTLQRLRNSGVTVQYKKAYVVSSGAQSFPSAQWQKLQQRFIKANKVCLNRYHNNGQILFSEAIA